ncbi:MAG: UDP-2,4-diacetamido-2,4,6-trideoxy-beta-L-altropyranose hydrolase [Peptostreptococcaceae bacterium]|nr:UDP-2,4-diacetamido-2,4,6-trideoxy-beta-L-altropyranose hydrolase [Peptostreptococcaceae bacterium]
MNFLFRVDGSKYIGLGHIMRSMSLAMELEANNIEISYLTRFKEGAEKLEENKINYYKMKNTYDNLRTYKNNNIDLDLYVDDELSQIKEFLSKYEYTHIIIDSYLVNKTYFLELKKLFKKVIYIDDLNKFKYPVDVIINGNIYAKKLYYQKYFDNTKLLLGLEYNLINNKYRNLSRDFNRELKEILITTGGSDPKNLMEKFIDFILINKINDNIRINIIIGKAFLKKNKDIIYNKISEKENFTVYEDINYMEKIMIKSDLAITSGGSTIYELMACGIYIVSFSYARNQNEIIKTVENKGYLKSIGNYEDVNFKKLKRIIKEFNSKEKIINEVRRKEMEVMNLGGVSNIVKEIIKGN